MRNNLIKTILVFFIFCPVNAKSQLSYTDSLWKVYNNKLIVDSVRHWALADLAWEYCYINPDSARLLARVQIKFATGKPERIRFVADANNTIGNSFNSQGYYDSALVYFLKNEEIHLKRKNVNGLIATYTNIAESYRNQGNYPLALNYCNKALAAFDKAGKNKKDKAILHNNIGAIYSEQGDDKSALKEYSKAAVLFKKLKMERELANVFNNISICYDHLNDFNKAMDYGRRSLRLRVSMMDSVQIANSYQHIASVFYKKDVLDSAYIYILKSVALNRLQNSLDGLAGSLSKAGTITFELGRPDEALQFCRESYVISKSQNILSFLKESCDCLYSVYKSKGDSKNALQYIEEASRIKDTLTNDDRTRQIARLSVQYEFDKERAADSVQTAQMKKIKDAEISAQKSQLKQEETVRYALYTGLALVIIFGLFIYNRFMITKKQKKIIEIQKSEVVHQKELVEEKNKEILDSIIYAKRLQDAILPPMKLVREYLSDSFILYKPKDIVAGDFYFMEPVEGKVIFAAADCTGHGVPGAMVSVVCANAMNRSVKEFGLQDPGKILDKVRELILETFEKSEDEVKDGMDISLCVLDLNLKKASWSGANNPIWLIRHNTNEIFEVKADKQPVGKSPNPKPFTTQNIDLSKGDILYLFTDGFEDQFGGLKGKKFKSSKMKEMFLGFKDLNMDEQRKAILDAFEAWKGELEQVDDVCVIGLRI